MTLNQLVAITPKKYDITCIDESMNDINFNENYDIVGITSNTPQAPRAYEIADKFRDKGVKVVMGGVHPSALPDEAKKHADSIVLGEGEESWPKLLNDFENKGKIKPFYQSNLINPELIPSPDRTLLNHFNLTLRVQATRGCPNNCEFCSLHIIEGSKLRMRPIENVIDEIRSYKGKWVTFVDNSLTICPNYSKLLFKKMQSLDKKFACFGNINVLGKDEELLNLAQKAGCIAWEVGLESVSQKSLNKAGKKSNKVSEYKKAIRKIKEYNSAVVGSFVFGFDEDTLDIFDQTLETVYELELDSASFNILTPYPGTRLYYRLENEGRILTKDWSKYDLGHVVFKPNKMSAKELFEGTKKIVKSVYNPLNRLKLNIKSLKLGFSPYLGVSMRNFSNVDFYGKTYFKKNKSRDAANPNKLVSTIRS